MTRVMYANGKYDYVLSSHVARLVKNGIVVAIC